MFLTVGRVKYHYTKISFGDQVGYRPMVDVILLSTNGEAVQVVALTDSGSDFCLFPLGTARLLGIDIARLSKASTVGVGSASNLTYFDDVTIDLGNGVIFTTRVGFTAGMDRVGFGLLGQQGFFENFNVEFRHRDRIFIIESPRIAPLRATVPPQYPTLSATRTVLAWSRLELRP